MVIGIPSHKINDIWAIVSPLIEVVTKRTHDCYVPEDIKGFCESQAMQLWIALDGNDIKGVVTTEIIVYPRRKILRVVTVGGEGFDAWGEELSNTLDKYAAYVGCDGLEAIGRKGWIKKLSLLGYEPTHVTYVKDLRG